GYFIGVDTDVRADELDGNRGDNVNFEQDLRFASSDQLFRFGGQFLFKPRQQLNVLFYELNRGSSATVPRDITWRDRTFTANSEVSGFFDTSVFELSYTYWWIARDNLVVGVNAGVQQLGIDVGLGLRATQQGSGINPDLAVDAPVPLVGFELRKPLGEKFLFRGIGRFVSVSGIEEIRKASVIDATLAVEHETFKHGGIGLAFQLLDVSVEVERRFAAGEVGYRIDGFELYLRAGF
ncbi:MAG: hypothetical protein OES47_12770, partial [Acidobacteriota bacterium]|nr:hypothetical protein [Acidobacteriota bacterium]